MIRRTGAICIVVDTRDDFGGQTNVDILNNDIDECHPVGRVGAIRVGSPGVGSLSPEQPVTATGVVNIIGNTIRNSSEDCLNSAIAFDVFRGRIERNRIVDFVQPCADAESTEPGRRRSGSGCAHGSSRSTGRADRALQRHPRECARRAPRGAQPEDPDRCHVQLLGIGSRARQVSGPVPEMPSSSSRAQPGSRVQAVRNRRPSRSPTGLTAEASCFSLQASGSGGPEVASRNAMSQSAPISRVYRQVSIPCAGPRRHREQCHGLSASRFDRRWSFLAVLASFPTAAPKFSDWSAPVNLGSVVNSPIGDSTPAVSRKTGEPLLQFQPTGWIRVAATSGSRSGTAWRSPGDLQPTSAACQHRGHRQQPRAVPR